MRFFILRFNAGLPGLLSNGLQPHRGPTARGLWAAPALMEGPHILHPLLLFLLLLPAITGLFDYRCFSYFLMLKQS